MVMRCVLLLRLSSSTLCSLSSFWCVLAAPQVKGLLLDDEVDAARRDNYLFGAHVVVGTPALVAAAMAPPGGAAVMEHTKVVAIDEVDACFEVGGWVGAG